MSHPSILHSRRRILACLAASGVGTLAFQRALAASVAQSGTIDATAVRGAEWIAGLELSDEDREHVSRSVTRTLSELQSLRAVELDNAVAPAFDFRVSGARDSAPGAMPRNAFSAPAGVERPASDVDLAFASIAELASLLRARKVSSVELTRLSLERFEKLDPTLLCVVHLTRAVALEQAERADREIAAGMLRGPLHGIPWGAKDLIAWPGHPTTWGAGPYESRVIDAKATVAARLEDAGAVLVAKLALGSLAMGDRWFRGMTRNPWNTEQGSSGSSAGSASATVAGLVAFAIGSETLGSIVSPCTRCGASGLRPTFGRVSRAGCMALSWTMDKIGPIARSIDDCALVFDAIRGADGVDTSVVDRPFEWPAKRALSELRIGVFEDIEDADEIAVLEELGVRLVPMKLPDSLPIGALRLILNAEAAAAFEDLTRRGVTEGLGSWPGVFRAAHFTSAVDYLRANRVRTMLMRAMDEAMEGVDAYVDTRRRDLTLTNFTGHPTAVLPSGFRELESGAHEPQSITFTGRLFGESELLAVASAWQRATGHHQRRPPLAS